MILRLPYFAGYMDIMFHLASRVSQGGFFVMDDYSCVGEAQAAADLFREWYVYACVCPPNP